MLKTLTGVLALIAFQVAGMYLSERSSIPIPGPVLGLALLLLALGLLGRAVPSLDRTATPLLRHLSLLFVPAGTGVLLHLDILRAAWLPIIAAIAVSTLLSLALTALTAQRLLRRSDSGSAS